MIAPLLAHVYIQYVVVEFSDTDNHLIRVAEKQARLNNGQNQVCDIDKFYKLQLQSM